MSFPKLSWVQQTNVYEVNTRQYTPEGTFRAFLPHIPRLKEMGVHTLWFMPVTPISQLKRKGRLGSYYACANYTSVSPEFGTMDDFVEIVQLAHSLDMKVIIDWVANHTGADHTWTETHPDFYLRNSAGEFFDKHGWDDVIDLDYGNWRMRDEMIKAMAFWVSEAGIDGFRCDMAMLVPVDFWQEARVSLDAEKKLFWLAECDQWNDPVYLEVFDAAYAWKWMHATQEYHQGGKPIQELKDVLQQYRSLHPGNAMRAWFTSNHDENSWNGTEYEKYGEMAIPLAVFSCTWDGLPLLYSGQEIPNRRRLEFFEKDSLDWSGGASLKYFYRPLLQLKNEHPALLASSSQVNTYFVATNHADKVIAYHRVNGEKGVLVILNFSPYPLDVQVYEAHLGDTRFSNLFTGETSKPVGQDTPILLPAWGYFVFVN